MTNGVRPTYARDQSLRRLIDSAIESEFGDIDRLPARVAARVREAYTEFMPIYIEMIRIREKHPQGWQPAQVAIDADMLEDMRHFFSDYQHITRDFMRVNRQVNVLIALDRQKDPHRYDEWVQKIVSGGDDRTVMKALIGP
jgi:hypothetical protein